MNTTHPGRPAGDECIPYFARDIELVPDGDIVDILERQIIASDPSRAALPVRRTPSAGRYVLCRYSHHLDIPR